MHIVFCRYLCSYWMLLHIWAKHAVIMALPLIIHTTYADEVWFKFSWHFIFLSLNRFRVCSALAASIVFSPWLDANGRCSQVAYPWRDRLKVVVLLPFGWILNEISYRLWLDWNTPSCGWYRTKFKRYMLIWSLVQVYLIRDMRISAPSKLGHAFRTQVCNIRILATG